VDWVVLLYSGLGRATVQWTGSCYCTVDWVVLLYSGLGRATVQWTGSCYCIVGLGRATV